MSELIQGAKFDGDKPPTELIAPEAIELLERGDFCCGAALSSLARWFRRDGHVENDNFGELLAALNAVFEDHHIGWLDVARVLAFGAKKYAPRNWEKGIAYQRLYAAALRHLFAIEAGEENDPETSLPHAAHAACEIHFLIAYEARGMGALFDDRPTIPVCSVSDDDDGTTQMVDGRALRRPPDDSRVLRVGRRRHDANGRALKAEGFTVKRA